MPISLPKMMRCFHFCIYFVILLNGITFAKSLVFFEMFGKYNKNSLWKVSQAVLDVVEPRGIEPLSEGNLTRLSPGAVVIYIPFLRREQTPYAG